VSYRERQRLADIQAAIDAIRSHMLRGGLSDGLVFDAVRIRLLEIGEAVKALPAELRRVVTEERIGDARPGPGIGHDHDRRIRAGRDQTRHRGTVRRSSERRALADPPFACVRERLHDQHLRPGPAGPDSAHPQHLGPLRPAERLDRLDAHAGQQRRDGTDRILHEPAPQRSCVPRIAFRQVVPSGRLTR